MSNDPRSIAVVILTKDELVNLPACISSLEGLHAEVFLIDSGSRDGTVEWARSKGITVLPHAWKNYATQMNWGLDNIETTCQWIMRLDADERLTPKLVEELNSRVKTVDPDVTGLFLRLRIYFLGRWIRYGGVYPTVLLRVWRRGSARCEDRWMDEHIVLSHGRTITLKCDFIHDNRKSVGFWTEKHNSYADREMRDIQQARVAETASPLTGPARRHRVLKEKLFWRMPRLWRAAAYWFYRYFVLCGFLDGREGFVFHFLHAFWYRVLVDAKLIESERVAPDLAGRVGNSLQKERG